MEVVVLSKKTECNFEWNWVSELRWKLNLAIIFEDETRWDDILNRYVQWDIKIYTKKLLSNESECGHESSIAIECKNRAL